MLTAEVLARAGIILLMWWVLYLLVDSVERRLLTWFLREPEPRRFERNVTINEIPVTVRYVEHGLWCQRCLKPSGMRFEVVTFPAGVRVGTVLWCVDESAAISEAG